MSGKREGDELARRSLVETTMDRLISTAWKAFWVGLGASAVLISQSVLSPAPAAPPSDSTAAPVVVPMPVVSPAAARVLPKSADPILSRNPLHSKAGRLLPHS